MTTGRINQVTIVGIDDPERPTIRGEHLRWTPESMRGLTKERIVSSRATTIRSKLTNVANRDPIASTEFPKNQSVPQQRQHSLRNASVKCNIWFSRGGYQPLHHNPEVGYQLRRAPKCLCVSLTIGHPSTDSIDTDETANQIIGVSGVRFANSDPISPGRPRESLTNGVENSHISSHHSQLPRVERNQAFDDQTNASESFSDTSQGSNGSTTLSNWNKIHEGYG